MEKLVFSIGTSPGEKSQDCQLMLESLRTFGGKQAKATSYVVSFQPIDEYTQAERERYAAFGAQMVAHEMKGDIRDFPFAHLPFSAALAEKRVSGIGESMVWMLSDSLVVQPLDDLELPGGISFAFRPVHHALIGSPIQQPPDDFWRLIYQHCGVPEERIFPMWTCVRDIQIRPYFNAGILVARPEIGLFAAWQEAFSRLFRHADFLPFYEQDPRYAVFMHQAVLSGVVLSMFPREEMMELPATVNYPLHLHCSEMPADMQPKRLNHLITFRYENRQLLKDALNNINVAEPLKSWLEAHIGS